MQNSKAAKLMRELDQEKREKAIRESDNVAGYERFMQKHNQVSMRDAYRKGRNED